MMNAAAIKLDAIDYACNEGFLNSAKHGLEAAFIRFYGWLHGVKEPSRKNALALFGMILAVMFAMMLFMPRGASAWGLDDIINSVAGAIGDWVKSAFEALLKVLQEQTVEPLANGFLKALFQGIESSLKSSDLLLGFDNLLGSYGGKFSLSTFITNVSDAAIKPVAATLLAMGMLLQLLKIAKKMDQGGGMMPSVREVISLFVWCAVMMYMVRNGLGIVKDLYTMVLEIIKTANSAAGSMGSAADVIHTWAGKDTLIKFSDDTNFIEGLIICLECLLAWIVGSFAVVISYYMMIARAIEIYLTAMFAPIPFALMGFDETRSWGWGYLKTFLSLCLAGVIMLVVLYMFPFIVVSIVGGISNGVSPADTLPILVKVIAACLVLAMTLVKSTQIARSVLGG